MQLLEETGRDGAKFVATVKSVLEREAFWVAWKDNGCESFERAP